MVRLSTVTVSVQDFQIFQEVEMRNHSLFLSLAWLLLFVCSVSFSATVVVRQDGAGGAYTTIQEAVSVSANGDDTIEIQQFTGPFDIPGGLDLSWRSLICTAPERATLNVTGGGNLSFTHRTLKNIKFVGDNDGVTNQWGIIGYGNVTIENCFVTGVKSAGIVLRDGAGDGGGITTGATVKDTYVIGPIYQCIYLRTEDFAGKGPVLINHCTLQPSGNDGYPVFLEMTPSQLGHDFSNVTVKNSIMTNTARCVNADQAVTLAYQHSFNDFDTRWVRDFWNWNGAGGTYDTNTPLGIGDVEKIPPAFTDPGAGDYSLLPTSKLLKAADDGGNIGAWQGGGYPTGDVIVRQDGQGGAYTTLQEAILVTQAGQMIEIQQHSAPFFFADGDNLNLANLSIICTTTQPAEIHFLGAYGIENADKVTLQNLHLIGDREGWQTGIKCGSGVIFKNLIIESFQEQGIWWLHSTGGPMSGLLSRCVLLDNRISLGTYDGSTNVGKVLLDHCTLYSSRNDYPNISFDDTFADAGLNGSNLEVKNSILRCTWTNIIAYKMPAENPLAYSHSYNDYIHSWAREVWDFGNSGSLPPGPGDLENVDPLFTNPAAGDLTLQGSSPLATAAEGGTTTGAYPVTAAGVLDWNLY